MWFLILLLLTGISQADVYVVTDQSHQVYSISEQNDAVIPSGYTLKILKGQNISNLPITSDPTMYTFDGGAFVINKAKIQAQQDAQAEVISKQTSEAKTRVSALAKLKALGFTDDEIKVIAP